MEVPGLLGSLGTQAHFLGLNMWVSTKEKIAPALGWRTKPRREPRGPYAQSCWEAPAHGKEQVSSKRNPKDRGILACRLLGRESPFEPVSIPICFPSSDPAMEEGRKERREMAGNRSSPLRQLREEH
ncbi:hypothetical protein Pyn_37408 [Prunus yedoensis var. nudiflora]|uniref:Uncharacterized protein n=1 Tax=Prunus yedoensis var. nudiflora TaxID=2094558 RepID=A0A314UAS0_PRUYE|nr:hypothetical protein Pyn_37408 [Prunus yedoensis var. nudiflora]